MARWAIRTMAPNPTSLGDAWGGPHLESAVDDKLPLIERGVPVHLPQAARGKLHQRATHGGGRGEVGLVGNVQVAAPVVVLRRKQLAQVPPAVIVKAVQENAGECRRSMLSERI